MTEQKLTKRCKYCAAGNVANERGEHWIVKSIFPAKIDIRKCTARALANTEEKRG